MKSPALAPTPAAPAKRFFDVRPGEWPMVVGAFFYFFFLLAAYYVLRPVRDEMGIQTGVRNLPWLFTGTFIGMLCAVPLFGWAASRFPRRVLVPMVYGFFIVNLLVFYALFASDISPRNTAIAFFIWLSVFNYFVVSVFWMLMADIFASDDAKRLFALIAAGGSLGAICGPAITALSVKAVGIPPLFLVSAGLMSGAMLCVHYLVNRTRAAQDRANHEVLGGGMLAGVQQLFANPYLLAIAGYILLLQILGTFFYLEQIAIVSANIKEPAARTELFATIDAAVNTLTLFLQVFITGHLVRRVGLTFCLALLPLLAVVSLIFVGLMPTLMVVAIATVLRRASEFAIAKPAREVLYTVITREQKYKAKNVIDTAVARGGDVVAAWSHGTIHKVFGLNTSQMAFATIPFAVTMIFAGVYLGRRQATLAQGHAGPSSPGQP
jgi:ATP:ADP antiporter, AAA family